MASKYYIRTQTQFKCSLMLSPFCLGRQEGSVPKLVVRHPTYQCSLGNKDSDSHVSYTTDAEMHHKEGRLFWPVPLLLPHWCLQTPVRRGVQMLSKDHYILNSAVNVSHNCKKSWTTDAPWSSSRMWEDSWCIFIMAFLNFGHDCAT